MIYKRYLQFARKQSRLLIIGSIAGLIAGVVSGYLIPYFVEHVFRNIFEDTSKAYSLSHLIGIAALLPAAFIFRGIAGYINQYYLQWTVQNILLDIRHALFKKLQTLPLAYFERRQSGDLMAKLVGDTLQVQQSILLLARDAFIQPFTFLGGLGYLIILSIQHKQVGFLLLFILLTPLMVLPVRYIGNYLKKRSRNLQQTLGELTDVMAENLRGVTEVRSFNLEEREKTRFMAKLKAYNFYAMKMAKYYHLTQPLMEILAVTMISIAFVYSYMQGIGFPTFTAMGMALYFAVDAVKKLAKIINSVQKNSGSFERIESILAEEGSVPEVAEPTSLIAPKGDITFEDVRFSYGDDENLPALQIDSLHLPLGTVCALVGPSGAGKSTFAKLIPRFYDPQQGRILFDGLDIRNLRLDELRNCIAFVPQAPVLFNGTIRENILLARPEARDEEVEEAARLAHAEEFILSLPDGYNSMVGENAVLLSGGQRQRLALARAFLKNAPVLILDEATSALDAESEVKIQEALEVIAKNRTVLIIAHRFATIRMANHILLFDRGHIRSQGDFDTVMEDSLFRRLYEIQLGTDQDGTEISS